MTVTLNRAHKKHKKGSEISAWTSACQGVFFSKIILGPCHKIKNKVICFYKKLQLPMQLVCDRWLLFDTENLRAIEGFFLEFLNLRREKKWFFEMRAQKNFKDLFWEGFT
jgi:hypothetical protein